MYSIYHFFRSLVQKKDYFRRARKLEKFPFDETLLSCCNEGVFPDLAIRLNKDKRIFSGGELIELKDSDSYTVSSFNSTIPSRSKNIADIIGGENSKVKEQMLKAGNDINSLPVRDVFYLVRGKKNGAVKVCLLYGSFFETISPDALITQSFSQVFEERLKESSIEIPEDLKKNLLSAFSQQDNFSKVRNVEKASVKLRFRIMTEVKKEGNILNAAKYPEIKDNTLNFLLPCHDKNEENFILNKASNVFSPNEMKEFKVFQIKHHLNGYFLVLQTDL